MNENQGPRPRIIEQGIVDLIKTEKIQDGLVDLAEASIDQLIQDGFLCDIPVLGSVLVAIRAARSFRDLLLAKKIGRFLLGLQTVPLNEREEFLSSLEDGNQRRKVGETLLLILDRLDDMEKPELIARLFQAQIQGTISRQTFQQLATAVDRLTLEHVTALKAFYSNDMDAHSRAPVDRDVLQALAFCGLVRIEAEGDGGGLIASEFAGATISYVRNRLGSQFVMAISSDV